MPSNGTLVFYSTQPQFYRVHCYRNDWEYLTFLCLFQRLQRYLNTIYITLKFIYCFQVNNVCNNALSILNYFFSETTLYEHLVSISLGSTIPPLNQGGRLLALDHCLMLWFPTWKFFHIYYWPIFVFRSNPSLIFIVLYSLILILWLLYLFLD